MPPDDAGWREWEAAGRRLIAENRVPDSLPCILRALDVFDSDAGELGRMLGRICGAVAGAVAEEAPAGRPVDVHCLAEIDARIESSFPDAAGRVPKLVDLIVDMLDGRMRSAESHSEIVAIAVGAIYAEMGFMRFSRDPREDLVRAARAAELCAEAERIAGAMGRSSGQISRKGALQRLAAFKEFSVAVKSSLAEAMAGMSDDDLDRIAEHARPQSDDILLHLLKAYESAVMGRSVRPSETRRREDGMRESIRLFAEAKTSLD